MVVLSGVGDVNGYFVMVDVLCLILEGLFLGLDMYVGLS